MRALLLVPAALLLVACGDCDCRKEEAPPKTTSAAATPATPPAKPAVDDADAWFEAEQGKAAAEVERKPPVVKAAWRGSGDTVELSVWEMHCGGCAFLVQEGLATVPGVKSVDADWETSVVKITLADAAQRDAVIAKLPAALKAVNDREKKEFRVLGE